MALAALEQKKRAASFPGFGEATRRPSALPEFGEARDQAHRHHRGR